MPDGRQSIADTPAPTGRGALRRFTRGRGRPVEASRRSDTAVAEAGKQLLASIDEDALIKALDVLMESTGALTTFFAENSGGAGSGPAAVVSQVSVGQEDEGAPIRWKLPYLQHRVVASALARGEPVRLDDAVATVLGAAPGSVHAVAVPLSVRGEWAGFVGIGYDLTDTPDPDPDLLLLQTVGAMIGSFLEKRDTHARLEQSIRARDQFLASVSHEIRTPLTSVLGFTSLLRDSEGRLSPEETREIIALIHQQAQEVADLVEDLLVAARAEIDAITVTTERVELACQVREVLDARLGTDNKDVHIAVSDEHVAHADPTRVRQIIRNLVTNALRYGGDQITVTTHRDGPEVSLVFSDSGAGIPPELGKRIFDPYHRGGSALIRAESVGLGLAVSRQLARLMDGDLMLRSDLGPATFQLTLPAAPADQRVAVVSSPSSEATLGEVSA